MLSELRIELGRKLLVTACLVTVLHRLSQSFIFMDEIINAVKAVVVRCCSDAALAHCFKYKKVNWI